MKTGIAFWMREFCWTHNSRVGARENAATKEYVTRNDSALVVGAEDAEFGLSEVNSVLLPAGNVSRAVVETMWSRVISSPSWNSSDSSQGKNPKRGLNNSLIIRPTSLVLGCIRNPPKNKTYALHRDQGRGQLLPYGSIKILFKIMWELPPHVVKHTRPG